MKRIGDYLLPESAKKLRYSEWSDESLYKKIISFSYLSSIKKPTDDPEKDLVALLAAKEKQQEESEKKEKEKNEEKIPTGRIELHTYLLLEKKKLEYVVHKDSLTGYEKG
eukprot:499921_1